MWKDNLKKELVKIGKRLAEDKLVIGSGGNISIRVSDRVLIKKSGVNFEDIKENDFIYVVLKTGKALGKARPSNEILMHLACYKARPDVNAVIHAHPVCATALANLNKKLFRHISAESAAFIASDIKILGYLAPGSKALSKKIEKFIKGYNAIILSNHGILTAGRDLKEAYLICLAIERLAGTILLSKEFGKPKFLTKAQIKYIMQAYLKRK